MARGERREIGAELHIIEPAAVDELHERGLSGVRGLPEVVRENHGRLFDREQPRNQADGCELRAAVLLHDRQSLVVGGVGDGRMLDDEILPGLLGGFDDDGGLATAGVALHGHAVAFGKGGDQETFECGCFHGLWVVGCVEICVAALTMRGAMHRPTAGRWEKLRVES